MDLPTAEWKATGEFEVQMLRQYPSASNLTLLTTRSAGIVSPDSIKAAPDDYMRRPMGTGPFTLAEAVKGNHAVLEANRQYWRPNVPKLGRVYIKVIADDAAMTAALLTGDVEATSLIDFKDIDKLRAAGLKVDLTPALNCGYIGLYVKKSPLDKIEVRQAISHAVNRQRIIDVVLSGQGDVASGGIPKASAFYAVDLENYYPYDVARAKQLLASAGLPNGFETDLCTQTNLFWPRMAELLQSDLAAVGVKANLNKLDSANFMTALMEREGNHSMFIRDATPGTFDPVDMVSYRSFNKTTQLQVGYDDKGFDDLLQKQDQATTQEARKQAFLDVQRKLLEDLPVVNLYYGRFAAAYSSKVQGFGPFPIKAAYFHEVSKNA